jgi:hypothetical protein
VGLGLAEGVGLGEGVGLAEGVGVGVGLPLLPELLFVGCALLLLLLPASLGRFPPQPSIAKPYEEAARMASFCITFAHFMEVLLACSLD